MMFRAYLGLALSLCLTACAGEPPPAPIAPVVHVQPAHVQIVPAPALPVQVVRVEYPSKPIVIVQEKGAPVCPSVEQIKEMAVRVSIESYRRRQNALANRGNGKCACDGDSYSHPDRPAELLPCGKAAIQPAKGVMCNPGQVPNDLVREMLSKISGC
jgi:hypothetical protein